MKHFFLLLLICTLPTLSALAQKSPRYAFVGILSLEDKKPCGNRVGKDLEKVFIKYGDTYSYERHQLTEALNKNLGRGYYSIEEFPVSADAEYYIAKVLVKLKCSDEKPIEVQYFKFCGGKTKAAVVDQLARDKKNTPDVIDYVITEEVDWRKELAASQNKTGK